MAVILSVVFLLGSISAAYAQPGMIGTHEVVAEQQMNVDREALIAMLDEGAVKDKLASMGVSSEQVEQRINSLTTAELAEFNQQLDNAPAGAGVVGIIALFLLVFIITDMLCATNVYNFVNCVR
ncbi:PA2779 family protein [Halopseudomonas salegens]